MNIVRKKCLDCSNDQPISIRTCPVLDCALWEHRFGRMPKTIKAKYPILLNKEFFKKHVHTETSEFNKILKKEIEKGNKTTLNQ